MEENAYNLYKNYNVKLYNIAIILILEKGVFNLFLLAKFDKKINGDWMILDIHSVSLNVWTKGRFQ